MQTSPSTGSRDSWASHAGFILAAVGSAVGLGNMWRFSYVASQGGGLAFVLTYMFFVIVVGVPLMTSEFVVGRMTQESPAKAIDRLGGSAWAPLGWLFVFCGLGILSYYSVIAGWTVRYAIVSVFQGVPTNTGDYFGEVSTGFDALAGHAAFMLVTIVIVMGGIKKGIERAAVILMPLLFFLLVGLAVWSFTLAGSGDGYAAYLDPSFNALLDQGFGSIVTQAAGQAFFSLSLGMGALMTYASYIRTKGDLGREAIIVSSADFGVAFMAGLLVFPIVYTFGLADQISESSLGALFISLPAGFSSLGTLGNIIGAAFFLMLIFAALTSSISLLEVVVAAFVDKLGWTRKKAAIVMGGVITLVGVPSAFNLNFLGAIDQVVGQMLLIVGGLFTAIFVGYKILPQADAELALGLENEMLRKGWAALIRYVIPVILVLVLYFSIPTVWAAVIALF
jgi:NSS family neurotransmitter:Na+ symporter